MQELQISTSRATELIDVTDRIVAAVKKADLSRGAVVAYVPHTTAGITINENADPSVIDDMLTTLARLVPADLPYTHREGNAHAHVKASLVGSSVTVPVENGRLQLGTWQGVFFAEFDGPRRRRLLVQAIAAE